MTAPRSDLARLAPDGRAARQLMRTGAYNGHTAGMAPGHVQANLAILPRREADDFLRFCQRNPKPCPLLAVSEPGDPLLPTLGEGLDLRSDLPRYRVWQDGVLVDEVDDIAALWRDDLVGFAIGCSFSFEEALLEAGVPLRHVAEGRNVAMYRTKLPTAPAGVFHGPMVVSMRPMKAADAIRAVQVTSRFPQVHGAPVHIGDPALIGIADLAKPDFGDAVAVADDELPVFWACGVTPQSVVMAARPAFCITHAPGCMLVTDLLNHRIASF
jgi:uncharacterized protein YcsI (UPF0317 family)